MKKYFSFIILLFFINGCSEKDCGCVTPPNEAMYFPPNDGSNTWETKSISEMGWNQNAVQPLLDCN